MNLFGRKQRSTIVTAAFLLVSGAAVLQPSNLAGQTTEGAILGSVQDKTGAIVPGATVVLTNTDEGTVRTAVTNSAGTYQFLDAKSAHYKIQVSAPGFEKWVVTGLELTARQQLREDVSLTVGAATTEVQVSGDLQPSIDTDTATVSAVLNATDVENLPINSRAGAGGTSVFSIVGTLPGVQADASGFSIQGGLPFQSEASVDGISIQDAGGNSPIADAFPSAEAISEIRVAGVANNAEYGQPGQVTIITKSGANKIHGSAFWYFQSDALNAIPYGAATKPKLKGNTFGASFSGPVVIPHWYDGRGRTFFYGDYEGFRFPQQTSAQYTVPTAAMKAGDFSGYQVLDKNGNNTFTGLIDPKTGLNIGYKLPSVSAISQKFLQFYPDPNHGSTTTYVDGQTPNYYVNQDASKHSDQFDLRGDQYFGANQKLLLWARYTWKDFPQASPTELLVPSATNVNNYRVFVTNADWAITPTLIDNARFGYVVTKNGTSNSFDGKAFTQGTGLVGLQNLFYNGIPELDFNNLTSLNADRLSGTSGSTQFVYSDSITWVKGRHNLKFGADFANIEAVSTLGFNGSDNYGTFAFNTSGSTGLFTGVDFADFLLGIPNQTFYDVVAQDNDGLTKHYHVFAQDEWKATKKLTLTYGLRYEIQPGYSDRYGDIGNFDPSLAKAGRAIYPDGKSSLLSQAFLKSANACSTLGGTTGATVNGAPCMPVLSNSEAGFPGGLRTYPKLRFMPRFGFAYRPFNDSKTTVRGGFGLYNITLLGSSFYSLTGTLQADTVQYTNTYNPTTHAIGYQWPTIYAGAGGDANSVGYGQDYFGTANSTNWKDPYSMQYSVDVDRDLGHGYAVRASFIGLQSRQLIWAPDENTLPFSSTVSAANQPLSARLFPNWGRINTRATGANESYNSFQLEASHRMSNGLQFNSTWTFANAMADNQGPASTSFSGENGGARATSILDRKADYGHVYGTRRNRWNTTAVYQLPVGRGKRFGGGMSRAADAVVGGWQLSSIFLLQSGDFLTPYFPSGQGDPSGTGSGLNSTNTGFDPGHRNQHADVVAGVNWKPSNQSRTNWVNAGAFTCPGLPGWTVGQKCTTGSGTGASPLPIGRFGNAAVGSVNGPGIVNLSTGLSKSFKLSEQFRLKAEGTFTNVLNHTNLGDPNLNLSSSSFGKITSGISADQAGSRTGQVSVRLDF